MRRYHVRLMVSVLVSLSAVAWAGESGQVAIAQSAAEAIAQTDAEALLEEGDRLYEQGLQQIQDGQANEALQSWQQALEIYRNPEVYGALPQESLTGEGQILDILGVFLRRTGRSQASISIFERLVTITRELGDRAGEGAALGNLGIVYNNLGQYPQAISFYEQRLAITRELGDRAGEGVALGNLGIVYDNLGQYPQAISFYEQYFAISRELGDRAGEGRALENLGRIYLKLSQYPQAIDFLEQHLAIARELGDRAGRGRTLGNLGIIYKSLGQYPQAIDLYEQVLVIFREIGDRAGEGSTLMNLGAVHSSLGQYPQAIDFSEQSLAIVRELSDRAGEGKALGNLGSVYRDLGQYPQAIALLEQSLAIARELGDRAGEGHALRNLGTVYNILGQYPQAINCYEQSLAIVRELGDRAGEGHALGNLGNVYRDLGQYPQAIALLEQSLTIVREVGDRAGEGINLGNLGSVYASLGQYPKATDFLEQRLAIAREIDDRAGEVRALGNLGSVYFILGQYSQAIDRYGKSLAIAREIGDRAGEGTGLNNLAATLIALTQYSQAEIELFQAVAIFETLRANLPDDQLISLIDTQRHTNTYINLKRALVAQEKDDEALTISERGRAQAFALQLIRRLRQTADDPTPDTSDPITLEQIQQVARATNTTLVEYALIFDQFLYIWVIQPSGDIELRSLELNGDNDTAIALSTLDGPLYRGNPEPSAVDTLVTDSRNILLEPIETATPPTPKLQELHTLLIDPIADLLPTDPNAPVAFIPQGSLFHVPFAALQDDNGTYLIEKHTILTAPSIQVLGIAHDTAQTRSSQSLTANPVIVGNPTMPEVTVSTPEGFVTNRLTPLPGAEAEAIQIASVLNTTALTDGQATEATIKAQLPTASLIHLATHGLLDYGESPLDIPGAIALAPTATEDGLLTSGEILDLELQADLAILSACDTGLGDITGDGVVGLSRSLITAGVPSVMVSLWAVNDASTSLLMQRFYEFLATDEFTKAEALRQAQLSLLYGEDVATRLESVRAGAAPQPRPGFEPVGDRHPYHWAPFVLIGNGL